MSPRRMTPPLPSQHPPLPSPARRETRGAPGKHPAARSPPTSLRRARQRSVELAQLLPNNCGRQRQVLSVALHRILSLPADDEAQEFLHLGVYRPVSRLIDIHVDFVEQRIAPVVHRFHGVGDIRAGGCSRQPLHLYLGRQVPCWWFVLANPQTILW